MIHHSVPHGAIPEQVVALCRHVQQGGFHAWVVGGSLRDVLMGREPSDWDLATSATPEQMMQLFRRLIPTGIEHGTVTVLWHGEPYELTTLRGEGSYSDSRRPDSVHFIDDIEQDLARRDFTVNAIAYDPLQDRLIDPFGGLGDLERGFLRTVGVAEDRFGEDGLRVLRAARFVATLEFDIEDHTREAITATLDAFRRVSPERVRDEWMKTLAAREPSRGFELMRDTGILGVTCPDLMEQVGCEQNRFHAYDVWTHTMHCMDACDDDPVQRLAGLMHDIGKPRTRELSDKTGDYTFYNHEHVGARMADGFLKRMRFSNHDRDFVVHLVRHHLVCYSSEWTDAAVRRFIKRVGTERVEPLLSLARADALAKGREVSGELRDLQELRQRIERVLDEGAALSTRDLAINGKDVIARLDVRPGRIIGQVLEELLGRVMEDPELNQRETLLSMVDEIGEAKK
ncbi:MAG: HD domain-containing protein [Myxococcales bacterium]|jgi:tRNA nucleotidyltransferase (CCA-adding enzyme)